MNKDKRKNSLAGWADIIKQQGEETRKRSDERKAANAERARRVLAQPLDDLFDKSFADMLREMCEEGPKSGLRDLPDDLTVHLVESAGLWFSVASH